MKKYFAILFFGLLVSGCATQKAWVYSPNTYGDAPVISKKTAVVLPFTDSRENINENRILVYLIPLMPLGWANLNIPEGQQMHIFSGLWTNYKPTEDYAKALAEEMGSAKIFEEAYFDFKKGNSDIIIRGKILNTRYEGTILSYGLSVYGPLLWLVGFPAGTASNQLSVEMNCVDAKSNEVIFSKIYTAAPYEEIGWIYAMPNDFNYSSMLKDLYGSFIADLKTYHD